MRVPEVFTDREILLHYNETLSVVAVLLVLSYRETLRTTTQFIVIVSLVLFSLAANFCALRQVFPIHLFLRIAKLGCTTTGDIPHFRIRRFRSQRNSAALQLFEVVFGAYCFR
jgi:hypothetical protein